MTAQHQAAADWLVGIDVGGTFTDLVAIDRIGGEVRISKRASTPDNQTRGIIDALSVVGGLEQVHAVANGSTVALNCVLERKGARVGVITTRGFEDVLEIGKTSRPNLFDLNFPKARLPLSRRAVRGVDERQAADGSVLVSVDVEEVVAAADALLARGCAALAICFLNSYRNGANEEAAAAAVQRALPAVPVTVSSALSRGIGEYERFASCVLNAYVTPSVVHYLASLEAALAGRGFVGRLQLMHSAGGAMNIGTARRLPVQTLMSGPASGVAAAVGIAAQAGIERLITFDIGGTSCDVCVIDGVLPPIKFDGSLNGLPLFLPRLDVRSIGAGGGSIAAVDGVGALSVGPRSAGAAPGPACYGRGGTDATVTDALLLLGRLPDRLGLDDATAMPLDAVEARRAVGAVAIALGIDPIEAAQAIVAIAETNMANLVRQMALERGFDVGGFALLSYGGGGALHGTAVARLLGMGRVVMPRHPGNLCALGSLVSGQSAIARASFQMHLAAFDAAELQRVIDALLVEVAAQLGLPVPRVRETMRILLSMRYVGQVFSLDVITPVHELTGSELSARFAEAYSNVYGSARVAPVEISHVIVAAGVQRAADLRISVGKFTSGSARRRKVFFDRWHDTPVYDRDALPVGTRLEGPAVIEEMGATTLLHPGQVLTVEAGGLLLVVEA